jgi:hypothetical protein
MVKDNSAKTAWFVPELTVMLSVMKRLILSSMKQVKRLTVWMMCVCKAVLCYYSVSSALSDKPFSAVTFMRYVFHRTIKIVFCVFLL